MNAAFNINIYPTSRKKYYFVSQAPSPESNPNDEKAQIKKNRGSEKLSTLLSVLGQTLTW